MKKVDFKQGIVYTYFRQCKLNEVIKLEKILNYIDEQYKPLSVVLYGSYSNQTNNLNSDFDALVISSNNIQYHDTSFIDDIQLNVFIYPDDYFKHAYPIEEFIQIFDGKIIKDTDNLAKNLQTNVLNYLQNQPHKTKEEIQAELDWCTKMLARVKRNDTEAMFRWHWLLIDSLEIFCDITHQAYLGPKKTLKWMEEKQPEAFNYYKKALYDLDRNSLENWIQYLTKIK